MSETELTQDEYMVLMIAASGEYMMPIGRWEKPVEDLVARGLLHRYDKFNNTITEAGKQAVKAREDADVRALIVANNALANVKAAQIGTPVSETTKLEAAAKALFVFADWLDSRGIPRELVLRRASEIVLKRALEFL